MKVLIVHAKAGAGHRRAAEAVFNAFKARGEEKDVVLIDCLDYTSSFFKWFYPQVYISIVRYLSPLWAFIYYSLDNRFVYAIVKPFRRINNMFVSRRFAQFLKKENPKVVISTQFFASEVVAALKCKGVINSKLISVVTDFGAHAFWVAKGVDVYVVASEDTKQDLLARNVPEDKIKITGIPIDPPLKEFNKTALRREAEIREDLFTVLVVGGGFGVGPIKKIVTSLDSLEDNLRDKLQVVVICSSNKQLFSEMESLASTLKVKTKIFGFVPSLYQMMAASDIIVSKSGGLTTSESLAQGVPMIIIEPIPGQEMKNCDFLVKHNAGYEIGKAHEVKIAVKEVIENPEKLEQMHKNAARLSHPDAADDVVELAKGLLEG